jgi:hypothetical protein
MRFFAHMLGKILPSSRSSFIIFRQTDFFYFFLMKKILKFKKKIENGLSMGVEA